MKTRIALLIALGTMTVAFAAPPSVSRFLLWYDHSGKDILGNDEVLAKEEYGIFKDGEDPNAAGVVPQISVVVNLLDAQGNPIPWKTAIQTAISDLTSTEQQIILAAFHADNLPQLVSSLPVGNYRAAVRVFDLAGLASVWSSSATKLDFVPPAAPSKVGCRLDS